MFPIPISLLWLLLLLGPLLILQKGLHREIQLTFFLITRRIELSQALFAIFFLPGVILHEGSHYVTAKLLGVKTVKFSLIPRSLPGGKLQLGFVETRRTDILRDSIIGIAPFIAGSIFVAYVGLIQLNILELMVTISQAGYQAILAEIRLFFSQPDVWIWFYLALAVSSTMLPSSSDRKAWMPLVLCFIVILVILIIIGKDSNNLIGVRNLLDQSFSAIAVVVFISIVLHITVLFPLWMIRHILQRWLG